MKKLISKLKDFLIKLDALILIIIAALCLGLCFLFVGLFLFSSALWFIPFAISATIMCVTFVVLIEKNDEAEQTKKTTEK